MSVKGRSNWNLQLYCITKAHLKCKYFVSRGINIAELKKSQYWYQNLFVFAFCPLSVIYKFI
jgi:hypothetical protein